MVNYYNKELKKTLDRSYNFVEKFTDNTGINRIDGIVYLNLDNRYDRRVMINKEIEKMNVDISKVNRVASIFIPKNGHKGCTQSHILALKIAQLNNWNNILILEDDAYLTVDSTTFNNNINIALDYFKNNSLKWDVLMFASCFEKKSDLEDIDILKKLNYSTTSAAYVVNKHYIQTLLDLFTESNYKMSHDHWGSDPDKGHEPNALDQVWNKLMKTDNWYSFKEDLMKQDHNSSSIRTNGQLQVLENFFN